MPKSAKRTFKERQKNFFKANSTAVPAEGFDINSMKSEVGFYENKLSIKSTNYAVKDLEEQEHGGRIKGRDFIARKEARLPGGLVKNAARITELKTGNKIVFIKSSLASKTRSGKSTVVSRKQAFIRAAIKAKELMGDKALVLGNASSGKRTLSLIRSIRFTKKGTGIKINRTPLYTFKGGRVVEVQPTNFMKRASFETSSNMDEMYIRRAQAQFKKHGILK
mgnify:CR=1 FL=1